MNHSVAALVLLAALMHACWNAALRSGRDRFWTGAAMNFFGACICLTVAPFLPMPERATWPYIVLSAIIHVIYGLLLVNMYRRGHFGVTYPVARGSSPLLIALGGAILTSELIAPIQFTGIALVSAGTFILAFGTEHMHRESIPPALATGASIAAYTLVDGLGARHGANAATYTVWMLALQGLSMAVAFLALSKGENTSLLAGRTRSDLTQAFAAGLIAVTGYGIVIWAMKHSPMGIVSALRETSVLFASLFGRLFLREPLTSRKLVAAIFIGAGAVCLH